MKFICHSDTHGRVPTVPEDTDLSDVSGWLHAGDLYDRLPLKTARCDFDSLSSWAADKNIYVVNGNHDVSDPSGVFKTNGVTGRVVQLEDSLFLVGVGWSGGRFCDLPRETDIEDVISGLKRQIQFKMKEGDRSVLLTHYPPATPEIMERVTGDPSGWLFDSVKGFVDWLKPVAVIQGHVHQFFGMKYAHGPTLMVFPGPTGGMLSITPKTCRFTSF